MINLGEKVKLIRKQKNLTQAQLGDILAVSKQAIANIESYHNNPSLDFVSKLIENLNINANWFLADIGDMFNQKPFEEVEEELEQKVVEVMKKYGVIEK